MPGIQLDPVNLAGNWHTEPAAAPASNVAAEEADRDARRATALLRGRQLFRPREQAEAEGKPSVAKIYYQMAARRSSGDFKQQVQARLDALNGRTTAVANNVK